MAVVIKPDPLGFVGKECCIFCKSTEIDALFGHVYKLKKHSVCVHYFCLLMASKIEQNGRDHQGILGFLPRDILKEVDRCRNEECYVCKKVGAPIRCVHRSCKKQFHLTCGIRKGSLHQFFGKFDSFCPTHKPQQTIPDAVRRKVSGECIICTLDIVKRDSYMNIWPTCCNPSSFLHRRCVQVMANNAGYYFKCPFCNNTDKFILEMKKCGIYIPEQEASWESEPHAYEELLSRNSECTAKPECLCPKGKSYNRANTVWQLEVCRLCGGNGIHVKCARGPKASPRDSKLYSKFNWYCAICKPAYKGLEGNCGPGTSQEQAVTEENKGIAIYAENNVDDPFTLWNNNDTSDTVNSVSDVEVEALSESSSTASSVDSLRPRQRGRRSVRSNRKVNLASLPNVQRTHRDRSTRRKASTEECPRSPAENESIPETTVHETENRTSPKLDVVPAASLNFQVERLAPATPPPFEPLPQVRATPPSFEPLARGRASFRVAQVVMQPMARTFIPQVQPAVIILSDEEDDPPPKVPSPQLEKRKRKLSPAESDTPDPKLQRNHLSVHEEIRHFSEVSISRVCSPERKNSVDQTTPITKASVAGSCLKTTSQSSSPNILSPNSRQNVSTSSPVPNILSHSSKLRPMSQESSPKMSSETQRGKILEKMLTNHKKDTSKTIQHSRTGLQHSRTLASPRTEDSHNAVANQRADTNRRPEQSRTALNSSKSCGSKDLPNFTPSEVSKVGRSPNMRSPTLPQTPRTSVMYDPEPLIISDDEDEPPTAPTPIPPQSTNKSFLEDPKDITVLSDEEPSKEDNESDNVDVIIYSDSNILYEWRQDLSDKVISVDSDDSDTDSVIFVGDKPAELPKPTDSTMKKDEVHSASPEEILLPASNLPGDNPAIPEPLASSYDIRSPDEIELPNDNLKFSTDAPSSEVLEDNKILEEPSVNNLDSCDIESGLKRKIVSEHEYPDKKKREGFQDVCGTQESNVGKILPCVSNKKLEEPEEISPIMKSDIMGSKSKVPNQSEEDDFVDSLIERYSGEIKTCTKPLSETEQTDKVDTKSVPPKISEMDTAWNEMMKATCSSENDLLKHKCGNTGHPVSNEVKTVNSTDLKDAVTEKCPEAKDKSADLPVIDSKELSHQEDVLNRGVHHELLSEVNQKQESRPVCEMGETSDSCIVPSTVSKISGECNSDKKLTDSNILLMENNNHKHIDSNVENTKPDAKNYLLGKDMLSLAVEGTSDSRYEELEDTLPTVAYNTLEINAEKSVSRSENIEEIPDKIKDDDDDDSGSFTFENVSADDFDNMPTPKTDECSFDLPLFSDSDHGSPLKTQDNCNSSKLKVLNQFPDNENFSEAEQSDISQLIKAVCDKISIEGKETSEKDGDKSPCDGSLPDGLQEESLNSSKDSSLETAHSSPKITTDGTKCNPFIFEGTSSSFSESSLTNDSKGSSNALPSSPELSCKPESDLSKDMTKSDPLSKINEFIAEPESKKQPSTIDECQLSDREKPTDELSLLDPCNTNVSSLVKEPRASSFEEMTTSDKRTSLQNTESGHSFTDMTGFSSLATSSSNKTEYPRSTDCSKPASSLLSDVSTIGNAKLLSTDNEKANDFHNSCDTPVSSFVVRKSPSDFSTKASFPEKAQLLSSASSASDTVEMPTSLDSSEPLSSYEKDKSSSHDKARSSSESKPSLSSTFSSSTRASQSGSKSLLLHDRVTSNSSLSTDKSSSRDVSKSSSCKILKKSPDKKKTPRKKIVWSEKVEPIKKMPKKADLSQLCQFLRPGVCNKKHTGSFRHKTDGVSRPIGNLKNICKLKETLQVPKKLAQDNIKSTNKQITPPTTGKPPLPKSSVILNSSNSTRNSQKNFNREIDKQLGNASCITQREVENRIHDSSQIKNCEPVCGSESNAVKKCSQQADISGRSSDLNFLQSRKNSCLDLLLKIRTWAELLSKMQPWHKRNSVSLPDNSSGTTKILLNEKGSFKSKVVTALSGCKTVIVLFDNDLYPFCQKVINCIPTSVNVISPPGHIESLERAAQLLTRLKTPIAEKLAVLMMALPSNPDNYLQILRKYFLLIPSSLIIIMSSAPPRRLATLEDEKTFNQNLQQFCNESDLNFLDLNTL